MSKHEKYICKSCEMEFIKPPKKTGKKDKTEITCPYCGSQLYHNLITKYSSVYLFIIFCFLIIIF